MSKQKVIEEVITPHGLIRNLWEQIKSSPAESGSVTNKIKICMEEIRKESIGRQNDVEFLEKYLVQPVDSSMSNILHVAAQNGQNEVVWYELIQNNAAMVS